jgi:hypothetical protein
MHYFDKIILDSRLFNSEYMNADSLRQAASAMQIRWLLYVSRAS